MNVLAFFGLFATSDPSLCSALTFPQFQNLDIVLAFLWHIFDFPLTFFFLGVSASATAAASVFWEWVQGGCDLDILRRECQVKFFTLIEITSFLIINSRINLLSMPKFRKAVKCCERVPELVKPAHGIHQEDGETFFRALSLLKLFLQVVQLFTKWVICYFCYLKSILQDDSATWQCWPFQKS